MSTQGLVRTIWLSGWVGLLGMVLMTATVLAQDRPRTRSNSEKAQAEQRDRATNPRRPAQQATRSSRQTRRSTRARQEGRVDRDARTKPASVNRQRRPDRARTAPPQRTAPRNRPSRVQPVGPAPRQSTQRVRRTPVRHRSTRPAVRGHAPKRSYRPKKHVHSHRRSPAHRRGGTAIDIDIAWPWPHRHRRVWRPRYRYQQVVHVEAAWGRHRRATRIDVRTRYRHRVQWADDYRAEIAIYIDAIELYADGRYLGVVDRIPTHLSRVEATLYRNGAARFDRELFLVGDPRVGFELIATRAYDRPLLDAYHRGDWTKAGVLDLYAGEVVPVRRSRLFRPHAFNGLVPISLLPEHMDWRYDAGIGAISARPYQGPRYDAGDYGEPYYYGSVDARSTSFAPPGALQRSRDDSFRLDGGGRIELTRTVQLERLQ